MWTLRTIGFWAATGLASLAVLLVIIFGWLVTSNASIRTQVSSRQQYINQSVRLQQLEQELLKELGSFALRNNAAIRQILAESGYTVVSQTPAQGQAAPAPSTTGQAGPTANPATPVPLKKP